MGVKTMRNLGAQVTAAIVYTDKLSREGRLDFSVAAVPESGSESSPQLPGHHVDVDLGRGNVTVELKIVAAPPFFSGSLTTHRGRSFDGPVLQCYSGSHSRRLSLQLAPVTLVQ